MEAAVANELHRLTGVNNATDTSSEGSEPAVDVDDSRLEDSDAVEQSAEDSDLNSNQDDSDDDSDAPADASSPDDDYDLGDGEFEQTLQEDDLASVPLRIASDDAMGTEPDDSSLPGPSGRDDEQSSKQSNARDLKATGVARAAARLLQQDTPDGGVGILSKSKSVAKRKAEEEAGSKADKAAKRLRLEMKHRGHEAVPKRGEDPEHDAFEKALLKTATRGVVRLFNAVSKAQKDQKDALVGGARSKIGKLDKASFLAELRGSGGPKVGAALPAGTGPATAAPAPVVAPKSAPAWDVLSEGFGLQGGAKMKDWDKQDDSDADLPGDELHGLSESDSE